MTKAVAPKRKRPSALEPNLLKTTLVLGSVLATYLGADLLASTDATQAAASVEPPSAKEVIEIRGASDLEGFVLNLEPIPDVVSDDQIPKPVAQSRSSN